MEMNTGRLLLRPYTLDDSEDFYNMVSRNFERLAADFPVTLAKCTTHANTIDFIIEKIADAKIRKSYSFGIFLKPENKIIGNFSIKSIDWNIPKCEFGYFIDTDFEGAGYTTEAVTVAVTYCFTELKMMKLFIRINPVNISSKRVAVKAGFTLEGLLKNEFRAYDKSLHDVEYYGKIPG